MGLLNPKYTKTSFSVGETVYIPELTYQGLPLPLGTATPFKVTAILDDRHNDELTVLSVSYEVGAETVQIQAKAWMCYKPVPQAYCGRCGHPVCRENRVKDYPYYCPDCDENMYGIEIILK